MKDIIMKILCRLLLITAIVSCIFSYNPVNASWFSNLFRGISSSEVTQDESNVIVRMRIPYNIDPYDIHIEIKEKTLYVYGKKERKYTKNVGYFYSEVSSSSFGRQVSLPCLVNEEESEAVVSSAFMVNEKGPEDYILRIVMPKAKPMTKKIKVSVQE